MWGLVLDWWLAFVQTRLPVYIKASIDTSLARTNTLLGALMGYLLEKGTRFGVRFI